MTDVDNIIVPVYYWVAKFLTYNKEVKIALNTTKIAQKTGSQTNCIIKNHPSKVEQSREVEELKNNRKEEAQREMMQFQVSQIDHTKFQVTVQMNT